MVDWTQPLEAVHTDGRVVPVELDPTGFTGHGPNPDDDGDYWIKGAGYEGCPCIALGDGDGQLGWTIRNRVVTPTFDTEHTMLIGRIRQWASDRNLIEGSNSQAQTVKLFEEGGEVASAVAKGNLAALKDGIGDMVVVLVIIAAQNGLTFEECVAAAYDEIKDRKGQMVDGVFIREQ